jgi:hypothetical protein
MLLHACMHIYIYIVNEVAERLAFFAIAVNMVAYLVTEMHQSIPDAATPRDRLDRGCLCLNNPWSISCRRLFGPLQNHHHLLLRLCCGN